METNKPNPLDELLEAVGRDVVPWDRVAEPAVAGQVTDLDERDNEFGSFPVVTILTGDGRELEVAGMGAVLRRAIMNAGLEPGDFLAVRYLGQRTPRSGGKAYHDYRIVVRDSTGGPKKHQAVPAAPSKITAAIEQLEAGFAPLPGEEPF